MLLGAPPQPPARRRTKASIRLALRLPRPMRGAVVLEVARATLQRSAVCSAIVLGAKPADVDQILRVRRQQPLARRQWRWWGRLEQPSASM